MRAIATNIDTLVLATETAPLPPDADTAAIGRTRGWRWSPAPGLAIECGTPNTAGVTARPSGTPLGYRWTFGPELLWSVSLADIASRWPEVRGAHLMRVDVARDWITDPDASDVPADDPSGWGAAVATTDRAASQAVCRLIGAHAHAWAASGRAGLAGMLSRPDGASAYRGRREKSCQLRIYHKTARGPRCEGMVVHYAHAWAAGGWPTDVSCSVCGSVSDGTSRRYLGDRCVDCDEGAYTYHPVIRTEIGWPRRYLYGRRWADLSSALDWPREARATSHLLPPLAWVCGSDTFEPPRQRRASRTMASLVQHHLDMTDHHAQRVAALTGGVDLDGDDGGDLRGAIAQVRALLAEQAGRLRALDDIAGSPITVPDDLPLTARSARAVSGLFSRGWRAAMARVRSAL